MPCFTMKARIRNHPKEWFEFSIADAPLMIYPQEFVLQNRCGTPRLSTEDMVRGCEEYGVYDGDIIIGRNSNKYMVCYDRGFYAISESREYTLLEDIMPCTVIGNVFDDGFPVQHTATKHIQFKYKEVQFSFKDFQGISPKGYVVRSLCLPVRLNEICSDCGVSYNGKPVCWDENTVVQHGRIFLKDQSGQLIMLNKRGVK